MVNISVIIPTMKGREEMLKKLISTIPPECEIIVVDDEDLLLAAKRNKGARQASGNYLLFIDDDNYLREGAVYEMMLWITPKIGVMGMMACYDNKKEIVADGGSKRNYLTGFTYGLNTNKNISRVNFLSYEVDELANAFMIPNWLFRSVGGFDEENFPIDLDEADICKRIKNLGYKIMMNPLAVCYHKSQTYSHIPNFRRPMNAYFMGRNRTIYQRKFNNPLRYGVYISVFMPVFIGFYSMSLIWRRKPLMIWHFMRGVIDGIFGRRKNRYQQG